MGLTTSLIKALILSVLFFSCAVKNLREPSSIKKADIAFLHPRVSVTDGEYDLLNIQALSQGKVSINTFNYGDPGVLQNLQSWREHLHWLVEASPQNLPLSRHYETEPIDQLRRLERALNLIAQSESDPALSAQKQIAILSAFNAQFKKVQNPNLATNNLPLTTAPRKLKAAITGSHPTSFKNPTSYSRRDAVEIDENENCRFRPDDDRVELNFSADCGAHTYRVFFGDSAKVAVFNVKLLREFGYYVDAARFIKKQNFKYDRELLFKLARLRKPQNQNVRKEEDARALAAEEASSNKSAVQLQLKSGDVLSMTDALKKLLPYCRDLKNECKTDASLLNDKFEKEIDSIRLSNISLQNDTPDHHHFGGWQFDDRRLEQIPDLHELYILSAFTGNWEVQSPLNTLVWSAKNFSVFYRLGRIDAGFGRGLLQSPTDLNAMHWEMLINKNDKLFVDGFHPRVSSRFVANISFEQWVETARALAGIDEDKLTRWLAEAGFSAPELMLAREKLLSLQKNMVKSLGLGKEFPRLADRKINREITYVSKETSHSFELSDGSTIVVANFGFSLKNGYLKSGP